MMQWQKHACISVMKWCNNASSSRYMTLQMKKVSYTAMLHCSVFLPNNFSADPCAACRVLGTLLYNTNTCTATNCVGLKKWVVGGYSRWPSFMIRINEMPHASGHMHYTTHLKYTYLWIACCNGCVHVGISHQPWLPSGPTTIKNRVKIAYHNLTIYNPHAPQWY